MAGRLNKTQLIGNLTRDPEIRYINNSTPVAKFGIAVNRKTKDKDETLFVDIVSWERTAEKVNKFLKKGMSVFVEGRLVIRSYEKDGEKRYVTEIVAQDVQMLERARHEGNGSASHAQGDEEYGGSEELDEIAF
jgi:single-strand DNA-binding protein